MEKWKEVPNYEGRYWVSNLGRVKNESHLLSLGLQSGRYHSTTLSKDGVRKSFLVHQLVAIAFLNFVPNGNKLIVDHIDNNPLNNNLENLQVITHRQNLSKDKKNKTSKYTGVSKHNTSRS